MSKRAIISVSDKTGVLEFARELIQLGFEIVSTGGTKRYLKENGCQVTSVSEITKFPECLDGRVKTLHPNILAGVLAQKDNKDHMAQISNLNIAPVELVCINLYPFKNTVTNKQSTMEEIIENIDIGGPTMLRSAAKNYKSTAVVTDINDYVTIIEEYKNNSMLSADTKLMLARKVFEHTAAYDALIADYFKTIDKTAEYLNDNLTLTFEKASEIRYGENPHQEGAFYKQIGATKGTLVEAKQLHGKELSYNNINDTDGAIALVKEFDKPAVVVVKHAVPCGVAIDTDIFSAYKKAYESDPVSIFGGIVACNGVVEAATAKMMNEIFLEVVIAPAFTQEALDILKSKKNLRLLILEDISYKSQKDYTFKAVAGGMIIQQKDYVSDYTLEVKTNAAPTETQKSDLIFAQRVVKHVKSNAIVLVKNGETVGIGGGQTNRVGALEIAIKQAGDKAIGSVLASDAFFPFSDCVELAAKAGIVSIIQPGGSIKDTDSINLCNEKGISMVFTAVRHFRH